MALADVVVREVPRERGLCLEVIVLKNVQMDSVFLSLVRNLSQKGYVHVLSQVSFFLPVIVRIISFLLNNEIVVHLNKSHEGGVFESSLFAHSVQGQSSYIVGSPDRVNEDISVSFTEENEGVATNDFCHFLHERDQCVIVSFVQLVNEVDNDVSRFVFWRP
jgi:hypothetical protein